MTQSGQGEEPSARVAREGIVLPSDGGEPLLPGTTSGHGGQYGAQQPGPYDGQQAGPYAGQQPGQQLPPPPAPAEGQAWGQPWGPEQQQSQYQSPPPPPGQGWSAPPAQPWGPPEPTAPAAPAYGGSGYDAQSPHSAYGGQDQHNPYAQNGPAAPDSALPPAVYAAPEAGALPPAVDADVTSYYLPPVAAQPPADEGATQYIPPVGPGALPPEVPSDATQFLGHAPQSAPLPPAVGSDADATQFIPPVAAQAAAASYGLRPGGPDDRQPPAEFDNLFRTGPGSESPAAATQQLPRFQQPHPQPPQQQPPYGAQQPPYAAQQPAYAPPHGDGDGDDWGGRTRSRVPLIAGVGIAIAVVGIGAGALLSGGGGDQSDDDNKTVSATAPTTGGSSSAAADVAKQQAVALDELLADSGSSRTSVINAVANVKTCGNLGQAATDLRAAAKQRAELVTRLAGLSVDKLPNNAALTTALTKAWKASAEADNHYAAWADQAAADNKVCKKGTARTTGQTQAGNRASGTASAQKAKAAPLWNAIATTYDLTERQATQL